LIFIHGIAFVVTTLICPKRQRDNLTQVNLKDDFQVSAELKKFDLHQDQTLLIVRS